MAYTPSHTARQQYLSCPRAFYLSRHLRLEKERDPAGLRMGKAFALAMETPFDTVASISQSYEPLIHDALTSGRVYDVDKLEQERSILRVLAPEYVKHYGTSIGFTGMIEREVAFNSPILGQGRLDGVHVNPQGYRTGIEDKLMTAGFWRAAEEKALRLNAQVTAYFAAMREMNRPLDSLIYRVTFKPGIKRDTRKGETYAQYEDRLRGRITADPSYAFREYELYRTDDEIDAFIDRVKRINQMIAQSKKAEIKFGEAAWPANMGNACTQFGECEFLDLCTGQRSGYRVKPQRVKLSPIQQHALETFAGNFQPSIGLYVIGLASGMGVAQDVARRAANTLEGHGLVERTGKGTRGRIVYRITDAGKAHLA